MSVHYMARRINFHSTNAPYLCGASEPGASNNKASVSCPDCLALMGTGTERPIKLEEFLSNEGVGTPTPQRHTPPRMEDDNGLNDGVFIFYGTHSDLGGQMEVVPMTTGNVELTISSNASQNDGLIFNLSHLDRADLIRALLHDFHYSPERGGPHEH